MCIYIYERYIYISVYIYIHILSIQKSDLSQICPPILARKNSADLATPWQRPWHGTMMPWRLLLAAGVLAEDHWEEGEG